MLDDSAFASARRRRLPCASSRRRDRRTGNPTTRAASTAPSLDPAKVFAVRAAGIQSSYDLAAMPIEEIVGRVRIDPRLLGRAAAPKAQ